MTTRNNCRSDRERVLCAYHPRQAKCEQKHKNHLFTIIIAIINKTIIVVIIAINNIHTRFL